MDIQLPLVNGYDATRRIKSNPTLRHIPIIAVTSYALGGDEAKTREAGCDGYVAKPFSPRKLLAKIQESSHKLDGRRMRDPPLILVVDDTPQNLDLLTRQLTSHGYAVDVAHDGEEALARVKEIEPDLILLDVMMPRLDGIETCSGSKQIRRTGTSLSSWSPPNRTRGTSSRGWTPAPTTI